MNQSAQWELGIIGAGPRCLSLLQHLYVMARRNRTSLNIKVFDPALEVGAGRIYCTSQPDIFRCVNLQNDFDIFIPEFSQLFPNPALSFRQWAFTQNINFDTTPSRATLGRYLVYAAKVVRKCIGSIASVEHIRELVSSVIETAANLEIHTPAGTYSASTVVMANGHSGWDTGPMQAAYRQTKSAPGKINDVESASGQQRTSILVEGAGLAMVETCLALVDKTNSRRAFPDLPWMKPRALAGQADRVVVRLSNKHLPLPQAKPTNLQMVKIAKILHYEKSDILRSFHRGHQPRHIFKQTLLPKIFKCADAIAKQLFSAELNCEQWLHMDWPTMGFYDSVIIGKHIVANQYHGHTGAACAAALSMTFSAFEADINRHSDYGQFSSQDRADYKAFRTAMESVAYGPTADLMGDFYKLIDQKSLVPLFALTETEARASIGEKIRADIPGPHDNFGFGIYRSLLAQHSVSRDRATGAVLTSRDGFAIRPDGSTNVRLAIFARASEHWVSGMDALSAVNSPTMGRWAQRAYECRRDAQYIELELVAAARTA